MNEIICGNAMEYLEAGKLDDKVDLVVTSPPYDDLRDYKGYEFDAERMLRGIYRALRKGGVCVWNVGDQIIGGDRTLTSHKHALYAKELGFFCHDLVIYQKINYAFTPPGRYAQAHELVYVFSKDDKPNTFNPLMKPRSGTKSIRRTNSGRNKDGSWGRRGKMVDCTSEEVRRTNVWAYPTTSGMTQDKDCYEHPAVMPEALASDCIRSWSNKGDVVMDPMCGSGTTCVAAAMAERHYIGMDISKEYCELAEDRLARILL